MAETLVDVVAKFRQRGKKDQPPKLLCDRKMAEKRRYLFIFYFLFFWKMPKNWVGRTTLNGEKKGDGLTYRQVANLLCQEPFLRIHFLLFSPLICRNCCMNAGS